MTSIRTCSFTLILSAVSYTAPAISSDKIQQRIAMNDNDVCFLWGNGTIVCNNKHLEIPVENEHFSEIDMGSYLACGITDGGQQLLCWNSQGLQNESLQISPALKVQSISVGEEHVCAIDLENKVICFGKNSYGSAQAPLDLTATSLSTSEQNTCALTPEKGTVCWGAKGPADGQGPVDVKLLAIDVTNSSRCAITETKQVICWGKGSRYNEFAPQDLQPIQLTQVYEGVCALEVGGSVRCWGKNGMITPPDATMAPFISVTSSSDRICGLKSDEDQSEPVCVDI